MSKIRDRVEEKIVCVIRQKLPEDRQQVDEILSIPEIAQGLKLYEQLHKEWEKGKRPPIRFPSPNPY